MDSVTQIVLGAAVGEVVLGKKVGNRALLWGGIGGTIPDLDVIVGSFLSPIAELATHRGFSHSIVFAIIGGIFFGWGIQSIYQSKYHKYIAAVGWFLIPAGVLFFLNNFLDIPLGFATLVPTVIIVLAAGIQLYKRYFVRGVALPKANLRDWQRLMFWSVFTHPLLDCFTTYGTQLFQPFSDYRVAFCSISVADPIYTVPFLSCIIILGFITRSSPRRRTIAWAGIGISSAYLLFTVINKQYVNTIWKQNLADQNIEYQRYLTSPTILNNVLWYCLAEAENGYYHSQYSWFDKNPKMEITFLSRNDAVLNASKDDEVLKTLKWFSNGYYGISENRDGSLQFNDLRFGITQTRKGDPHYIFNFPLTKKENGEYDILGTNGGPPPGERQDMLDTLWTRIKGRN